MRFFITGAGGQLGHDVMNEVNQRGHEAVGSGSKPAYSGVQDGSAVCSLPYVQLDIRDRAAVTEIIAAARAAHIHDMILSLPDGYDTVITDSGNSISKGQKQLLTIARAMLMRSSMLILD